MLTLGSLFSGIGGFDLGLERAGFRLRWQVEIHPWRRAVLAQHWPDVARYTDVRDLTGYELEPVDCIAGGFPCQPVSVAGRRRGTDDERWLWPHFARVIRALRPRIVLVENVRGIRTRGLGAVLGDLAACGYDAEWDGIPAASVGAPHLRDRTFVVAYAREQGFSVSERAPVLGARGGGGETRRAIAKRDWWAIEPDVDRVAHGIPGRVDRLRGLGDAVVPQVAELIGRLVMERLA